jgi:AcrR family transcriptional regulator
MGNREELLRGAREALLECGYAGATAREISSRAGTSLAAIGYHFGGTQPLLHEAIAEGFREWRAQLGEVMALADDDPEAALSSIGKELDRFFLEDRGFFTVFLEAMVLAERTEDVRRQGAASYEEDRVGVANLVAAVRGDGSPPDRTLASALMAVVDGLFIQHLLDPQGAPAPRDVLALFVPIILGDPAPVSARVR